ncbi:MAG: hypothetical protein HY243_03335 [Proteobacteria bacterium]|nr:hypothetical protein [Pseudomonadota bacterium]
MDIAYVRGFLTRAVRDGLAIAAPSESGVLCGEIHAYRMGPAQFRHVARPNFCPKSNAPN